MNLDLCYSSDRPQGIFYVHFPTDRTAHTTAFDGPSCTTGWNIRAQTANASTVQDRLDDPNLYRWVLYRLSYVPLPYTGENTQLLKLKYQ